MFKTRSLRSNTAEKAFAKMPDEPEYRLFAGLAAYRRKDMDRALALLESATSEIPRTGALQADRPRTGLGREKSSKSRRISALKQALLDKHGVQTYFAKKLKPLLEALDQSINRAKETDHD